MKVPYNLHGCRKRVWLEIKIVLGVLEKAIEDLSC